MHIRVLVLWTGHRCGNFAPANERCIVQGNMYRLCIRSAKRQRKKKTKRHTEKTANVIQKREDVPGTKCSPLGVLTFPFPSRHSRSSPCCARRSTARSRARHDTGPARCRVVT
ncbi:TPA_asm: MC150R [Molluscum contagiosum virus]|nr:MC150 [Molluscum contagiosum virus subtype 1]DBA41534.1 TPA_asm: MC150R [Molluscum contagiosum virus]DBA41712.1 TPA_asm: MC150R [Molluscum contagiosum virus]DBA41890.1 TPA_asm: MC150R [Molluscum contagiosum virus]DBA42068.1 TPA_asm: MC150R [Molluscum contagiosum virus]